MPKDLELNSDCSDSGNKNAKEAAVAHLVVLGGILESSVCFVSNFVLSMRFVNIMLQHIMSL
jgi:hypothetical protein